MGEAGLWMLENFPEGQNTLPRPKKEKRESIRKIEGEGEALTLTCPIRREGGSIVRGGGCQKDKSEVTFRGREGGRPWEGPLQIPTHIKRQGKPKVREKKTRENYENTYLHNIIQEGDGKTGIPC